MDFPTFILTLLSGNWLFFNDDEIAWDGQHHQITGIQVNSVQVGQFMDFVNTYMKDFEDIQDVVNYFLAFLGEVEKDNGLIVPRDAIAPGIRKAIRQGDLTGITLANLAACGAAFQVKTQNEDDYIVIYDTRLGIGIPSFYNLIARLLWDLRQGLNSKMGVPFSIVFMGARNIDANKYIDDVPKKVIGAQDDPSTMHVDACPEIDLSTTNATDTFNSTNTGSCFEPFYSGFDDPTEMQADEELFDSSLLSLCRSFPMTMTIEGTHVHGRAERIESIEVGDSLTLAADWQTEFFNPVGIEVFNQAGDTLGYLSEGFSITLSGHRELACLLPFITATVESVTPLSQRKGSKYALMDIRLELDKSLVPGEWDMSIDHEALKAIKSLLAKPKAQRVILSHSTLSPQQLKGSVDISEALEDPYGSLEFNDQTRDGDNDLTNTDDDLELDEATERDTIIATIQLLVLTGQLNGTQFPQELLDQLERAVEGDESIDIEKLAEQFNDAAPEIQKAEFNDISFSENRRVDGRRFSIAVPDNWTILKDVEDGGLISNIVRPFVILPHEANDGDDISLSDRIMYSSIAGDIEVDDESRDYGIPAMKWALHCHNSYSKTDELGALKPTFIWDEEVDALNTQCFVAITDPRNSPNGLDCYIYPYALDHNDFLRGTFYFDEDTDLEQVKNFTIELAKSVKLDDPMRTNCEIALEKALQCKTTADEYTEMLMDFMKPFAGLKQMVFDSAQQKYLAQADNATPDAVLLAGARGIVEFTNRAVPVFAKMIDAYEKQLSLDITETDANKMLKALEMFDSVVFPTTDLFSDEPENARIIDKAGIFNPSLELQQLRGRIPSLSGSISSDKRKQDITGVYQDTNAKRLEKIKEEEFKIYALSRIADALTKRISSDEYASICETVGFGLMQKRQEACNSATSSFNSDEDNVTAMCREFGQFNYIIARYIEYMLDLLDAQIELRASNREIAKMSEEAEELLSLITDHFSCGDEYLDLIANNRAPIRLPRSINRSKNRIIDFKRIG